MNNRKVLLTNSCCTTLTLAHESFIQRGGYGLISHSDISETSHLNIIRLFGNMSSNSSVGIHTCVSLCSLLRKYVVTWQVLEVHKCAYLWMSFCFELSDGATTKEPWQLKREGEESTSLLINFFHTLLFGPQVFQWTSNEVMSLKHYVLQLYKCLGKCSYFLVYCLLSRCFVWLLNLN